MPLYRNKKTGALVNVASSVKGGWELVDKNKKVSTVKTTKEKEPKKVEKPKKAEAKKKAK